MLDKLNLKCTVNGELIYSLYAILTSVNFFFCFCYMLWLCRWASRFGPLIQQKRKTSA